MSRPSFSADFKRKLVDEHLVARRRVSEICRQYQVGETALRRWIKQHEESLGDADAKAVQLARELEQAQQRVEQLEGALGRTVMELDFMKRCFKRAGLPFPNGPRS